MTFSSLLDRIIHYTDSHHIAVIHKGRWYKVFMFYRNNLLEPCELQLYVIESTHPLIRNPFVFFSIWNRQLDEIIRDATPPAYAEEHLAALTAGERTTWAEARQTYFRANPNRSSLEAIEKAAFILALDDEEYELGTVSESAFFLQKKTNILTNKILPAYVRSQSGKFVFVVPLFVSRVALGVELTDWRLIGRKKEHFGRDFPLILDNDGQIGWLCTCYPPRKSVQSMVW